MKRYSNALLAFSYGLEIDQFKNQELLAAFESTKEALSKQTYGTLMTLVNSLMLEHREHHVVTEGYSRQHQPQTEVSITN